MIFDLDGESEKICSDAMVLILLAFAVGLIIAGFLIVILR